MHNDFLKVFLFGNDRAEPFVAQEGLDEVHQLGRRVGREVQHGVKRFGLEAVPFQGVQEIPVAQDPRHDFHRGDARFHFAFFREF